jgi:hypothetical protein
VEKCLLSVRFKISSLAFVTLEHYQNFAFAIFMKKKFVLATVISKNLLWFFVSTILNRKQTNVITYFDSCEMLVNSDYVSYFESSRCRDRAVSIATDYRLDNQGVGFGVPVGERIFTSPCRSGRLWGPPASYPMGTRGSFPGDKAAGA